MNLWLVLFVQLREIYLQVDAIFAFIFKIALSYIIYGIEAKVHAVTVMVHGSRVDLWSDRLRRTFYDRLNGQDAINWPQA